MNLDGQTTDGLVSSLRSLVDIPSVSHNEAVITEHLASTLPDAFEVLYQHDTVVVALPRKRRTDLPLILLAGHTDTVPIADNVPSTITGAHVFGRGTSDMKSGLAVMSQLANWWAGNETRFDLGICYFGREELSQADNPLPAMLDSFETARDAELVIVMEPTSNAIEVGCQGNIDLQLTFNGTSAHSARPWTGDNAAHKAILTLQTLASTPPNDVNIDGLVYREVANVTMMDSGIAHNVLPPTANVTINIRYAPNRDPKTVVAEWTSRFAEIADVSVIGHARPGAVVNNDPLVQQLLASGANAIAPKQAWTNVADFTERGIPAVNFGPGDPAFAHRDDENIAIAALVRNYEVLRNFFSGE